MHLKQPMAIVRYLSRILLLTSTLLLLSCAGSGYRPSNNDIIVLSLSEHSVADLLIEADLSPAPQKQQLWVKAAEQLWQQEEYEKAINLLMETDANYLSGQHLAIYSLLYGRWTVDKQQWVLAETLLDTTALQTSLAELEPALAILLHELRREYFESQQQYLNAITEQQALFSLLMGPAEQAENAQQLWQLLRQLPESDLIRLQQNSNTQLAAWAELTQISFSSNTDLDTQVALLDNWLQRWPQHPAAQPLPEELQLLQQSIINRPQHITLLLPLSGKLQKAGQALQDGFFAAYYNALQQGQALPQVRVMDSANLDTTENSDNNFLSLYRQAASETDLIIGPLDKNAVELLANESALPTPTLALNYLSSTEETPVTANLFQFGLNPEDEARQAAQLMHEQQRQQALVISPDNDKGQRIAQAFLQQWLNLGGEASGQVTYNPETENYAEVIQQALGITDSKARHHWFRQFIPGKLDFEPRRRQDIDVIYLAAKPKAARQIKPLLAFHYAGDIPVYATSSIYSGKPEPEKNTDLNDVFFSAMPWLFSNSVIKRNIDTALNPNPHYQPLYAMGADAWQLYPRLTLLAGSSRNRLNANTGLLQLDPQQHITRQQLWAMMRKGEVKVLPSMPR